MSSRVISTVLALTICVGTALADLSRAFATETALQEAEAAGVPRVVSEVTERRTETAKHFRLSDGSYRAVISPSPVHYMSQ